MEIFKAIILTTTLLLPGLRIEAQNVDRVHVSDISITKSDMEVVVKFNVSPRRWRMGLNSETTVTPVLVSADGGDSLAMRPFTVAGKNAWYHSLRDGTRRRDTLLRAAKDPDMAYTATVAREAWMDRSHLDFVETARSCCAGRQAEGPVTIAVAEIDWRKRKFRADYLYVAPPVDSVKEFNLSGSAFVNFPVGRTEVEPTYMDNEVELQKILATVKDVKENGDATVGSIALTGYASPEGSYRSNERLAAGRRAHKGDGRLCRFAL